MVPCSVLVNYKFSIVVERTLLLRNMALFAKSNGRRVTLVDVGPDVMKMVLKWLSPDEILPLWQLNKQFDSIIRSPTFYKIWDVTNKDFHRGIMEGYAVPWLQAKERGLGAPELDPGPFLYTRIRKLVVGTITDAAGYLHFSLI